MRQFAAGLWLLLMVGNPISAYAFKGDYHEGITGIALSYYKTCQQSYPNQLREIHADNGSLLAAASGDIDRFSLLHLRRSLSRLWNWHFYDAGLDDADNPHASIEKNWLHMNRSLHRIFIEKVILASQRMALRDKDFFILSGEVLHFVQDMAVPAHVVPIYHDIFKPDDFDGYVFDTSSVQKKDIPCSAFLEQHESPETTLTRLAQDTRAAIVEHIDERSDRQWTVLWDLSAQGMDVNRVGFYTYGVCGNVFDQAKHRMVSLPQVCQIEPETINTLYKNRYEQSLDASLRVLIFLNRK